MHSNSKGERVVKKVSEVKEKYVLTVGLVRIIEMKGKPSMEIPEPQTLNHMKVMLTQEESQAWYRMIETIVEAQVKEKNKQFKG